MTLLPLRLRRCPIRFGSVDLIESIWLPSRWQPQCQRCDNFDIVWARCVSSMVGFERSAFIANRGDPGGFIWMECAILARMGRVILGCDISISEFFIERKNRYPLDGGACLTTIIQEQVFHLLVNSFPALSDLSSEVFETFLWNSVNCSLKCLKLFLALLSLT